MQEHFIFCRTLTIFSVDKRHILVLVISTYAYQNARMFIVLMKLRHKFDLAVEDMKAVIFCSILQFYEFAFLLHLLYRCFLLLRTKPVLKLTTELKTNVTKISLSKNSTGACRVDGTNSYQW